MDGTPIQISELPTSLPGYLLHMKAEFRVDGQVVLQTATSFTMGSAIRQSTQYFNPSTSSWTGGEDNDITVGEYNAIGIDLQGISVKQLQVHQAKLEATRTKLGQYQANPNDLTPINSLSKDDLTGDILQSGMLGFFTQVDTNDQLTARTNNDVVSYRLPSYGRFFAAASPHIWFGIVRSVTFPGFGIDVDSLVYHAEAKDSNQSTRTKYMRQVGAAGSAAEHGIPEQFFRSPNKPANDPTQPQGISAVRAISIAASQGQKIYTFNSSNTAAHSALYTLGISSDVKNEIANALAVGKEVTVHEKDIAVNGWTGSGYIILDPDTGSGAYKLDGGTNGGYVPSCAALAVMVVAAVIIAAIIAVILLPFIIEAMVGAATVMGSMASAIKVAVAAFLASSATYAAAGNSNGGGGGVLCGRDAECEAQLSIDDDRCVAIAGPRYGVTGISICQSAAIQRYSECLRDGVSGIRTPLTGVDTGI